MSANDTYLAVFLGSKTSPKWAAWNALSETERRAKEQQGVAAWKAWVEKHQSSIAGMGGPWVRPRLSISGGLPTSPTRWVPSLWFAPRLMKRPQNSSKTIRISRFSQANRSRSCQSCRSRAASSSFRPSAAAPVHVKMLYMDWRKEQQRRAERGYHHGNLKEALLQAALDLIGKKGAAGFTFADAARMAGVSPAAPYRHFRDRDELLSSIAQRGFEQFEALLTAAWDDGRPDTLTAFERVGKAYLAFASEEPAYYSAMFESGLPADANPPLMAASERAFAVIRAAAERLAALSPPGVPRPPAMMMALHIWSMSHGVASLFARGDAARRKLPMTPDELLEAEVLIYLRGLGFQTDRRPSDEKPPADEKPAGPWGKPK